MPQKKALIIVESPAKTKTLKNFLGAEYDIQASVGHVRDLPKSRLGVNIENNFEPTYTVLRDRKKVVDELKKAAAKAGDIFLASDPDREGEAIAWHVAEALKLENPKRIEFNEITRSAVTEAFKHSRQIDDKRVGAQQARRVLDRLVGYKISPLLWARVKSNLSAGRVQSVAVRLIVEREREITAFVPVEYWSLIARLSPLTEDAPFDARLVTIADKKAEIANEEESSAVVNELTGAQYQVAKVVKSERRRNASAPFITSTLQQEASRKLGFGATRAMRVAQDLYEGIDLGEEGPVGLITYLRTDSTRIAPEAIAECRNYIAEKYGDEFLPKSAKVHKSSNRSAQDAHECIRPTSVLREPESIKAHLSVDQMKLYKLIWQRFVASQMNPAVYDVETVDITAGRFGFRATGSTERFAGFRILYTEGTDETPKDVADEDRPPLPRLAAEDILNLLELVPAQHFTEPPPRFTEASLVKLLEEKGIGRPSTYASIVGTIRDRGYVDLIQKRFQPTDLGLTVNDLLVKHFPEVLNVSFTAGVESQLDDVEDGKLEWVKLLQDFYGPFKAALGSASETMETVKVAPQESDEDCPNCGRKMLIRESRHGEKFLGCSGFPDCKTTKSLQKPLDVKCPKCHEGDILERRSKRGKIFYGCNRYPNCDFVLWDKPIAERCPDCGGVLVEKTTRTRGHEIKCSADGCRYSRKIDDAVEADGEAEAAA